MSSNRSAKSILITTLLVLSVPLATAVFVQFIARSGGNCSSTGYASYGPVAKCPGGAGLGVLGFVYALFGWLGCLLLPGLVRRLMVAAFFFSIASGLAYVHLEFASSPHAASAWNAFPGFVVIGVLAVAWAVFRTAHPKTQALPKPEKPPPSKTTDPLDRIAKLSELHNSGALTDEEFATQKARLLEET